MFKLNNLKATQKWLMASALLVVLGIQLNWNSAPSVIARNDLGVHEVQMAQSAPPGTTPVKPTAQAPVTPPVVQAPAPADPAPNNWAKIVGTGDSAIAYVDLSLLDPADFPKLPGGGAQVILSKGAGGKIIVTADKSTWSTTKEEKTEANSECVACAFRQTIDDSATIPITQSDALRSVVFEAIQDKKAKLESHIAKEVAAEQADLADDDDTTKPSDDDDSRDTHSRASKDVCEGKEGSYMIDCATDEYNNHLKSCEAYQKKDSSKGNTRQKLEQCKIELDRDFKNLTSEMGQCTKSQTSLVRVKKTDDAFGVTDDDCQGLDDTAHSIIANSYRKDDIAKCVSFVKARLAKDLNDTKADMASQGYNKLQIQQALYEKLMEESGAVPVCQQGMGCKANGTPLDSVCINDTSGYGLSGCSDTGGASLLSEIQENDIFGNDQKGATNLFNKNFYTPYANLTAQSATDMANRSNVTNLTGYDFMNLGGANVSTDASGGQITTSYQNGHVVTIRPFTLNAANIRGGTIGGQAGVITSAGGLVNLGGTSSIIGSPVANANGTFISGGTSVNLGAGIYNSNSPTALITGNANNIVGVNTTSNFSNGVITRPTSTLLRSTGTATSACAGGLTQCRTSTLQVH